MTTINTELLLDGLKDFVKYPELAVRIEELKNARGLLAKITTFIALLSTAILTVENIVTDLGENGIGEEKKKAVVKFLDDVIDLPFWAEPFDGLAFGSMIEALIPLLNLDRK